MAALIAAAVAAFAEKFRGQHHQPAFEIEILALNQLRPDVGNPFFSLF